MRAILASVAAKGIFIGTLSYAQINALLGDRDEVFRRLSSARRVRDPGLMGWVFPDPLLDPLRSDPRYDKLVRELGYVGTP